ncbi:hypothetical protein ACH3XW_5660 [Acanthocheilonema viteae]
MTSKCYTPEAIVFPVKADLNVPSICGNGNSELCVGPQRNTFSQASSKLTISKSGQDDLIQINNHLTNE